MTFHEIQFPTDIAYGVQGGPQFSTAVAVTGSGFEQRNALWAASRGSWNAASGLKNQTQLDALVAFFLARQGRLYGFRFKDWSDYKGTGQAIGTGDGSNKNFQLKKTYTSGPTAYTRIIKKPVAGTVKPYLAGVLQTSGFTVNTTTGIVTFSTAPGSGVAVTADFEFDVPVRFDTDQMSVSLEQYALGQWSGIPIIELRV